MSNLGDSPAASEYSDRSHSSSAFSDVSPVTPAGPTGPLSTVPEDEGEEEPSFEESVQTIAPTQSLKTRIYISCPSLVQNKAIAWYRGATAEEIEATIVKAAGLPVGTPIELRDDDAAVVLSPTLPNGIHLEATNQQIQREFRGSEIEGRGAGTSVVKKIVVGNLRSSAVAAHSSQSPSAGSQETTGPTSARVSKMITTTATGTQPAAAATKAVASTDAVTTNFTTQVPSKKWKKEGCC